MQEVMKDGSTGKLIVKDTLEDLLPYIKMSLTNPRVNFVKVFKGTKIVPAKTGKTAFEQRETFAAEENQKDILESLKEEIEEKDYLPQSMSDPRKK